MDKEGEEEEDGERKNLISIQQYAPHTLTGGLGGRVQRIIMGNLIFPLRFRSVSYRFVALVILHWYIVEYVCMDSLGSILLVYHTKPSQSTAAVRVGQGGRELM